MNKQINVTCDECKKDFIIKKIITETIKEDIQEQYFECPYCSHKYNIGYSNNESREIQKELKDLIKMYKKKPSEELVEEIEELQTRHKFIFYNLKKYIEEGM